MKRSAILSLLLVAVLVMGAGLGTYAWFTSTVTTDANEFIAGTLVLDLNKGLGNTLTNSFEIPNIKPGDTGITGEVIIKNTGDIDLAWFGGFETYGATDLAKALYIKEAKMEFQEKTGGTWTEADDYFITNGVPSGLYPYLPLLDPTEGVVTLNRWMSVDTGMGAGNGMQMGALRKGFSYRFTFELGMLESAGDVYQGQRMGLKYVVNSTQVNLKAIASLKLANPRITYPTNYTAAIDFFNGQIANQSN